MLRFERLSVRLREGNSVRTPGATGQAAPRGDDLPAARAALERARDLYRGELLGDMPYAEWAFSARERVREAHLEALEALGTCLRLGVYAATSPLEEPVLST